MAAVEKGGPATKFAVKSALVYGRKGGVYAFDGERYSLAPAKKAMPAKSVKVRPTPVPLPVTPKKKSPQKQLSRGKATSGGVVVSAKKVTSRAELARLAEREQPELPGPVAATSP